MTDDLEDGAAMVQILGRQKHVLVFVQMLSQVFKSLVLWDELKV